MRIDDPSIIGMVIALGFFPKKAPPPGQQRIIAIARRKPYWLAEQGWPTVLVTRYEVQIADVEIDESGI